MKIQTSALVGDKLNYWVARALGYSSTSSIPDEMLGAWYAGESDGGCKDWNPSGDWEQAGPIIEKFRIGLYQCEHWEKPAENIGGKWVNGVPPSLPRWAASVDGSPNYSSSFDEEYRAESPLVAAMCTFVASKFGDEVEDV